MPSPLWLFLRARYGQPAILLSFVAALLLAGDDTGVDVPVTGESVPLPFIWPAVSVVPVVLVSRSRLSEWERRGLRRLALLHAVLLLLVSAVAALLVLLLQPQAWRPLLAEALALQGLAVLGQGFVGEWTWLLVAALGSLTVVRNSLVQSFLVSGAVGDRTGVALWLGGGTYALAVLAGSQRARSGT